MNVVFTAVDLAAKYLLVVSRILLTLMMLIIVGDVITRGVFGATGGAVDLTFRGGIELVRFSLLFTIVCALPAVVEEGQVVVETFTNRFSDRKKAFMFAFYLIGFLAFGVILAIGWYKSGMAAMSHGETTQDLKIPKGPIYFGAGVCALVLAARALVCAVRRLGGGGPEAIGPGERT